MNGNKNTELSVEEMLNEMLPDKNMSQGDTDNADADEAKAEKMVNALLPELSRISEQISVLQTLFDSKIARDALEEKIVDQMHAELQKYKSDMYSQLVRPILLDIIDIRDSILRISEAIKQKSESNDFVPIDTFEMYAFDIQEILEKNNIEIIKSDLNSEFVPVQQRAITKVPTAQQELHGKIAEIRSNGYSYMGKVISAEKVAVYIYDSTIQPSDSESAIATGDVAEPEIDKSEQDILETTTNKEEISNE